MSETLSLINELIVCPSITPKDMGCQKIISQRLEKLGFTIEALNFNDVSNLWAYLDKGGPVLCFAGHTDVVPVGHEDEWQFPPFKATCFGEYLYGRGTADMKSALASMIVAVEQFLNLYPNSQCSLAFLITSDEEGPAKDGTQRVIKELAKRNQTIDYCIIGEPSCHEELGDTIRIGRRGSLHGQLMLHGIQGHVAYPETFLNPIHQALLPLNQLACHTWDSGSELFPPTHFQVTKIESGLADNVVPGLLKAQFNFRFSDSLTVEEIQAQTNQILSSFSINYELQWTLSGLPFVSPKDGRLVSQLSKVIKNQTTLSPQLSTGGGTSDGRFIAQYVKEVIEFGHCNQTIHQINEHIKIDDIERLTSIYLSLLESIFLAETSAT